MVEFMLRFTFNELMIILTACGFITGAKCVIKLKGKSKSKKHKK